MGKSEQIVETSKYEQLSPELITNMLENMHRSKGYLVIRDEISRKKLVEIQESEHYQRFQAIKQECKQSFEHDRKMASNADVDRACTAIYTLLVKMIGGQGDAVIRELGEIHQAINRIEEAVGIPQTKWGLDDDTTAENGTSVPPSI